MAACLDEANENISEMSEAGERVLSFAEMPLSLDVLKAVGYEDGMTNIFLFQILGNEFEHGGDPFGVFNIIQGLSVFGLDLTAGKWIDIADRTELMWYAGGVVGFGIIANAVSYTFDFKREKKKKLTDSNIY